MSSALFLGARFSLFLDFNVSFSSSSTGDMKTKVFAAFYADGWGARQLDLTLIKSLRVA
jgi:hypothetical protein